MLFIHVKHAHALTFLSVDILAFALFSTHSCGVYPILAIYTMLDGQEYAETGDYTSIQLLLLQLYNWLAFLLLARQTSNWEMLGPQEEIGWARQLSLSLLSRRLWRDNRPAFVHVLVKKEKLTDEHVRWSVKEYKQQQQTQYNTTAAWRVYIKTGLMLIACCSRLYLTPVWVEKRDLWARPFPNWPKFLSGV